MQLSATFAINRASSSHIRPAHAHDILFAGKDVYVWCRCAHHQPQERIIRVHIRIDFLYTSYIYTYVCNVHMYSIWIRRTA